MPASFLLFLLSGCGLDECVDLCAARAACVSDDIDANSSTWSDWTGFSDQAAYEQACLDTFTASRKASGSRGELQDLCEAEQENACGGG